MKFKGYLRKDGKAGIRNHVLIIPSSGCAAHVAAEIAYSVKGTEYLDNQYGCGQAGKDLEQTFRTLSGMGKNPNVGAVLVVGLGCETLRSEDLAGNISLSGKPVDMLLIQESGGTSGAISKGINIAEKLVKKTEENGLEYISPTDLILGLECGGSDTTSGLAANPALGKASDLLVSAGGSVVLSETTEIIGAEHLLAKRAVNSSISEKLLNMVALFEGKAAQEGSSIRDTQPTPGNKAGGLTTLEEKSLGCIYKAGTSVINDVLEYAQEIKEKGITVMNTPGHDVQSINGMLAGGVQIVAFTTGRGTPCGNPIAPVVKITANKQTLYKMRDNIDVFTGDLIEGSSSLEEEGEKIFGKIIDVASGELTCSEKLGHKEFAVWRIGTSY